MTPYIIIWLIIGFFVVELFFVSESNTSIFSFISDAHQNGDEDGFTIIAGTAIITFAICFWPAMIYYSFASIWAETPSESVDISRS